MKCKASATQEARPINEIGEPPSSAPPSHSLVQAVLQMSLHIEILCLAHHCSSKYHFHLRRQDNAYRTTYHPVSTSFI
ncbi:MAG: hypothetical protein ORN21_05770 [Methylophilaceae bacterium]|nr:hypothetical protein [Methylophilaceae bacterium]